jgi:hypothetical protein
MFELRLFKQIAQQVLLAFGNLIRGVMKVPFSVSQLRGLKNK